MQRNVVYSTIDAINKAYSPRMSINVSIIRRAIEADEIFPYFQPIVDLRRGRLTGFEILARWKHPKQGFILPHGFIALAEERGLIGKLMEQVLQKAFQVAPLLRGSMTLSVNVSPMQLRDKSLTAQILELAVGSGFPMERLTVEITESSFVDNMECALEIVHELKAIGCRLALDDFGTGFSSLQHLQMLPFDELKVDRSFIQSMTCKRESRKIVAAILGLGHSLGMLTVGEGIETEEQAEMLRRLGCEQGQGWLYGRPAAASELRSMILTDLQQVSVAPKISAHDVLNVSSLEALPTQRLAQLRAIYDGSPVGLCFLDTKLRYVNLNERLAIMNGATVEEHLGRTVKEMLPDAFEVLEPYLARALLGEAIGGVEIDRPSSVPGEPHRKVLASYQPAWDEAEEVIGISVAIVDLSEHKRAEASQIHLERQQALPMDLGMSVPWSMNAEGESLLADSPWMQWTGLRKRGTLTLGWLESVHSKDVDAARKKMMVALRTGDPIDMEYRAKGELDEEWRWKRSRGEARFGPSGEVTRWFGGVVDIEERRQIEEALLKSQSTSVAVFDAVPLGIIVVDDGP